MPSMKKDKTRKKKGSFHHIFWRAFFEIKIAGHYLFAEELMNLVLPPEYFAEFNWSTLAIESTPEYDKKRKRQIPDLVFTVESKSDRKKMSFLLLLEHKSRYEKGMLRQSLRYQNHIYQSYTKPILPILIYHGRTRNWNGPLQFSGMLDDVPEALTPLSNEYVLDFKCMLLNAHDAVADDRTKGTGAGIALFMMSKIWGINLDNVMEIHPWLMALSSKIRRLVIKPVMDYAHDKNSDITADDIIKIEAQLMPEGDRIMGSLIESIQEEYFDRGISQGIEQGIEQGISQGIERGIERTAENLLRLGYETDEVCRVTNLERAQVDAIRRTLK